MSTNAYPEKPIVKYQKTTVEMGLIVSGLKDKKAPEGMDKAVFREIVRAAYVVFRNESGNGSKGINNNYVGAQADASRWPDKFDMDITGVVYKTENNTGKMRIFLSFASYMDSIDFLVDRIQARGLYLGGTLIVKSIGLTMAINSPEDLAVGYQRSWVKGSKFYIPTEKEDSDFLSMYRQAVKIFI